MSADFENFDYTYLAKDEWLIGQDQISREDVYRRFFFGYSADEVADEHYMINGTLDDTEKFIVKYLYILGVSELHAKQKTLSYLIKGEGLLEDVWQYCYGQLSIEDLTKKTEPHPSMLSLMHDFALNALALEKAVFLDAIKNIHLGYSGSSSSKNFINHLANLHNETKSNIYLNFIDWVKESLRERPTRDIKTGKSKSVPERAWKLWTEEKDVYGEDILEWVNFGVLTEVQYNNRSKHPSITLTNEDRNRVHLSRSSFRRIMGAEMSKEECDDAFAEAYSAANNFIDQEIAVLLHIARDRPRNVFEIIPASAELDTFHPVAGSVEKLAHYKKTGAIHDANNAQGSLDLEDMAQELSAEHYRLKTELEQKSKELADVDVDLARAIQHFNKKLEDINEKRKSYEKRLLELDFDTRINEDAINKAHGNSAQKQEQLQKEIESLREALALNEVASRLAHDQLQEIDEEIEKIQATASAAEEIHEEYYEQPDNMSAEIQALSPEMQAAWYKMQADAATAQRDAALAEKSAQYFQSQAERRANLSEDDRQTIAEAFIAEQKDPTTERAKRERQNTIKKLKQWTAENKLYGTARPIKFNGKKTLAMLQQRVGIAQNKQGNLDVRITAPYYANENQTETNAYYVDFIKHSKTGIVAVVLAEDNKTLIATTVMNEHPKWVKHQDIIVGADQTNYATSMQQRLKWHKEISDACARDI